MTAARERAIVRRQVGETLRVCREAVERNKVRSGLSILGVVFGIAAVTSMMSVSLGARDQVLRQVDLLGLRNIVIRSFLDANTEGNGLTVRDLSRLQHLLPDAEIVTPVVSRFLQVQGPVRTTGATVVGVEAVHGSLMRLVTGRGRFLSLVDDEPGRRVCILGATVAQSVFGYRDPVDQQIRLGGVPCRVVGVLQPRTATEGTVDRSLLATSTRRSWCRSRRWSDSRARRVNAA